MLLCGIAYSAIASEKPASPPSGIFGVCGCSSGENNKAGLIELTLNADSTFRYIDNSRPSHPLLLEGKWTMKKNKVSLLSSDHRKSFHRKWKYSSNGQCIKSRYGLNFRSICLIKPC
jgi:hypothetical protein